MRLCRPDEEATSHYSTITTAFYTFMANEKTEEQAIFITAANGLVILQD